MGTNYIRSTSLSRWDHSSGATLTRQQLCTCNENLPGPIRYPHTALRNQLYQKHNPEFWIGVVQPGSGIATLSLMDIFAHLYANYGQVNEGDLEEARSGITAQFEFATLPMEKYLFKVCKCQQLHGNALPPQPITDTDAMEIAYLNLQRSGLYPLECREWEMRTVDRKTSPHLQTAFIAAERRLRVNRGMGVPQGLCLHAGSVPLQRMLFEGGGNVLRITVHISHYL